MKKIKNQGGAPLKSTDNFKLLDGAVAVLFRLGRLRGNFAGLPGDLFEQLVKPHLQHLPKNK